MVKRRSSVRRSDFKALAGAAHIPLALIDPLGFVRGCNRALTELLGATPVGQALADVLYADDLAALSELLSAHGTPGTAYVRWLSNSGSVLTRTSLGTLDAAGDQVLFIEPLTRQDILPAELWQQIVRDDEAALLVTDEQGRLRYLNSAAAALFGLAESTALGGEADRLLQPRRDGEPPLLECIQACLISGESETLRCRGRRGGQTGFSVEIDVRAVRLPAASYALLRAQDLSQDGQLTRRLGKRLQHDGLTGLPNRASLLERLQEATLRAQRDGRRILLIYIDLDRFKYCNETLGHQQGDNIIRLVGERLAATLRETDTLARLGGDEFAAILENQGAQANADHIARKILNAIAAPMTVGEHELFLTAALGMAVFPADGTGADSLLRHAELAMYHAKHAGGGTYCRYDAALIRQSSDRLQRESRLRHALERGEFELFYQPQLQASGGRIVGLEALLRWRDPARGLISPQEFIPLLEETRLIIPVGAWILETACRQAKALEAHGFPALRMAVNISAPQFREPDFVAQVTRILQITGLPANQLDLEITESLLMEPGVRTQQTLADLSALGVRISIDDFGTGYSSLAYLKRFRVDTIKIDGSFISGIPADGDDIAIATAIVAMAEQLQLEVVAEAVETQPQLQFLRRWPGMLVQGFLFSPPVPVDQLSRALHRLNAASSSGEDGLNEARSDE